MNCKEAYDLIQDYVDGRVAGADRKRLSAHTADCSSCAEDLRWYQALAQDLAALEPAPAPSGFADAVVERLRRDGRIVEPNIVKLRIVDTRDRLATLPSRLRFPMAVAVVLLVAFVVFPSFVGLLQDAVGTGAVFVTEAFLEVQDQFVRLGVLDRLIDGIATTFHKVRTMVLVGFSLLSTLGGVLLLPALGIAALLAIGLGWFFRAQKRGAHHASFTF